MSDEATRIFHLRNCPMCGSGGDDVRLLKTVSVDLEDGSDLYAVGFSVDCINCGVEVHSEYRASAVRLWNGEPDQDDTP